MLLLGVVVVLFMCYNYKFSCLKYHSHPHFAMNSHEETCDCRRTYTSYYHEYSKKERNLNGLIIFPACHSDIYATFLLHKLTCNTRLSLFLVRSQNSAKLCTFIHNKCHTRLCLFMCVCVYHKHKLPKTITTKLKSCFNTPFQNGTMAHNHECKQQVHNICYACISSRIFHV